MSMKVFLYFDGVSHGVNGPLFDAGCLGRLAKAFIQVGAEVVIISSWRDELGLDELRGRLTIFADRVTADAPADHGYTKVPRELSIREFFHLRGEKIEQPWLAVDDNASWYGQLQARVVETDGRVDFADADLAVFLRLAEQLRGEPEQLPWPRIRDLPTHLQKPFWDSMMGRAVPVNLDDSGRDTYYWHDYMAWRQRVDGDG